MGEKGGGEIGDEVAFDFFSLLPHPNSLSHLVDIYVRILEDSVGSFWSLAFRF